jgi:hypothetical protein
VSGLSGSAATREPATRGGSASRVLVRTDVAGATLQFAAHLAATGAQRSSGRTWPCRHPHRPRAAAPNRPELSYTESAADSSACAGQGGPGSADDRRDGAGRPLNHRVVAHAPVRRRLIRSPRPDPLKLDTDEPDSGHHDRTPLREDRDVTLADAGMGREDHD